MARRRKNMKPKIAVPGEKVRYTAYTREKGEWKRNWQKILFLYRTKKR